MQKLGWHIVRFDRKLGFNDMRTARVGVRMEYKPRPGMDAAGRPWRERGPVVCKQGMHACPTLRDAHNAWRGVSQHYTASNEWICRVLIEGTGRGAKYFREDDHWLNVGSKFVGTHRTVLGMVPYGETFGFTVDEEQILKLMRKRNRRNGTKVEVR